MRDKSREFRTQGDRPERRTVQGRRFRTLPDRRSSALGVGPYHRSMAVRSVSFDDDDDEGLWVFGGRDLLISHYDIAELDWVAVGERTLIDERRGLVITQVAALEDLIDEFILYLEDPQDTNAFRLKELNERTIGPRLIMLEKGLKKAELLDEEVADLLAAVRAIVDRRNRLAHGTVDCRPIRVVPISQLAHTDLEVEWVLIDRRSGGMERISMTRLREDVLEAIGAFTGLLAYAERFVERAPKPAHFLGGYYLGAPTP